MRSKSTLLLRRGVPSLLVAASLPHSTQPVFLHSKLGPCRHRHRSPIACHLKQPAGDETFESIGLCPQLLSALDSFGIEHPTDIQRIAFPVILEGGDAVLLSETGSGKTLSYALPILHRLLLGNQASESDDNIQDRNGDRDDQMLVLAPNRDLCAQILSVFTQLIAGLPPDVRRVLSVSSLVSESHFDADATILISTPAVAIESWRGPESIRCVVLDEADALLAGSFKVAARQTYPIERLIAAVKRSAKEEALRDATLDVSSNKLRVSGREGRAERARLYESKQFVLVGATMPNAGTRNAEEHVKRLLPLASWHRASAVHRNKRGIRHIFLKVDRDARGEALRQALALGPQGRALVFANTQQSAVEAFEETVRGLGRSEAAIFHGNLPVYERAALLARFGGHRADSSHLQREDTDLDVEGNVDSDKRTPTTMDSSDGQLRVLVCTGLAARGIDFKGVTHVVQYEVASNAVEFMHRVGRTARAGATGVCTTLYTEDRSDLVDGLREALTSGKSVDHLFSRKRSFKLKLKKQRRRDTDERTG